MGVIARKMTKKLSDIENKIRRLPITLLKKGLKSLLNKSQPQAGDESESAPPSVAPSTQTKQTRSSLSSSWVREFTYDSLTTVLYMTTKRGAVYTWNRVPKDIALACVGGDATCRTDDPTKQHRWWVGKNPSLGASYWTYLKGHRFTQREQGTQRQRQIKPKTRPSDFLWAAPNLTTGIAPMATFDPYQGANSSALTSSMNNTMGAYSTQYGAYQYDSRWVNLKYRNALRNARMRYARAFKQGS
jgi:hypothetical protein